MQTRTSVLETVGVEAKDLKATIKLAGLNWEPLSDSIQGTKSGVEMPRMKLLYRSDTKAALGVVGEGYNPSNPAEFLERQYTLAEALKGTVTRAGFLEDRARAFSFIRMPDIQVKPKAQRQVGDVCGVYIYTTDGWDGGTPHKSRLFIERLCCKNGMTSKEIKANFWVPHTSGRELMTKTRWTTFSAEVSQSLEEVRATFVQLIEAKMTPAEMLEFTVKLFPGEGNRVQTTRDQIAALFGEGTGTRGATRWDAYNAVTEYVTHERKSRVQEDSGRTLESNRFLKVLEKDKLAPRALELLSLN